MIDSPISHETTESRGTTVHNRAAKIPPLMSEPNTPYGAREKKLLNLLAKQPKLMIDFQVWKARAKGLDYQQDYCWRKSNVTCGRSYVSLLPCEELEELLPFILEGANGLGTSITTNRLPNFRNIVKYCWFPQFPSLRQ